MEVFVCFCIFLVGISVQTSAHVIGYTKLAHPLIKRSACTVTSTMSDEQKNAVLDVHNQARQAADPAPYEALVNLTWDDGLASRAQELADTCIFAHDMLTDCDGAGVGQNLAYTTGHDRPGWLVQLWVNEKAYYNLSTGACSYVCGHYTQVVWANTKKVGCGYNRCNIVYNLDGTVQEDFTPQRAWVLVCDYSPPGNYQGQKPYRTEAPTPPPPLADTHSQCTDWIWVYCDHTTYGAWANHVCALTCSDYSALLQEDKRGSQCASWIYQYCGHSTYGYWAKINCALTCSQLE